MPGTMMDEVANDLALWIDQTANDIALAFAPTRAPFAAQTTEAQKIEYYRQKLFNPDGSPNAQGRNEELQRLGVEGFGLVYKAIIRAHPELKIPTPEPIAVPDQWPTRAPSGPAGGPPALPGAPPGPPGGSLPGPGAAAPPLAGPRMPVPPRPPMMPRPMASGGVVTEPTLALIGEAGPEAVVPLADYQYQQPNYFTGTPDQPPPAYVAPQPGEIEAYIRQAATQRNINPDIATRVAYFEGGRDLQHAPNQPPFTDPAVLGDFSGRPWGTGKSWWPYQLHYGGPGYEQWGTTAGLGNQFTEATGYQPGDPAAWKASVDFALDNALKGGWSQWYGAGPKGANVSNWQGLPRR